MKDELSLIYKYDTWDLVPLSHDQNVILIKWVFRVKHNADKTVAKFKARLIAKGFQQREVHDYIETFAPVVKWNTLQCVVPLTGHLDWTKLPSFIWMSKFPSSMRHTRRQSCEAALRI